MNRNVKISKSYSKRNSITLFHGDCLDLLKTIPDNSFKLIITSPPYNLGKEYEKKLKINEYVTQQQKVISECVRVLKENGNICWQVGNYVKNDEIVPLDILLYNCFKSENLILRNRIIWHFGYGFNFLNRFSGRYETILWFTKSKNYTFNLDSVRIEQKYPSKKHYKGPKKGKYSGNPKGKNPSDVWDIPNIKSQHIEKTIHPCQFPVALVQRLVLALTNEKDIVFDPFSGVGSTVIAAIINNRKAVGSELYKKYFNISLDRINKALCGELKFRPDVPIYELQGNSSLLNNPFKKNKSL